jgi:hypothetical protein
VTSRNPAVETASKLVRSVSQVLRLCQGAEKYELLLKTHGIKVDDEEPARKTGDGPSQLAEDFDPGVISMLAPRARNSEKGALFAEKENSHYVEKYFLPPL